MFSQFEIVVKRLFEVVPSIQNQTQLAEALEIKSASVSDAKKRGKIPPDWINKLAVKYDLNASWLLTGKGDPFVERSLYEGMSQQEIEDMRLSDELLQEANDEEWNQQQKVEKIFRVCTRITAKILKSKTRYVPVLLDNLRTLEAAVDEEARLQRLEETSRAEKEARLKRLEDDLAEVRSLIRTLLSEKDNSAKPGDKE